MKNIRFFYILYQHGLSYLKTSIKALITTAAHDILILFIYLFIYLFISYLSLFIYDDDDNNNNNNNNSYKNRDDNKKRKNI